MNKEKKYLAKEQIRIKHAVAEAILATHKNTQEVATHIGVSPFTIRYKWLNNVDSFDKVTPALINAIASTLSIPKKEVTETFHPINKESTIN